VTVVVKYLPAHRRRVDMEAGEAQEGSRARPLTVWVRRAWNDHRTARYRVEDLNDVHWDDLSGGVRVRSPRTFLHAYVSCEAMLEGELAHSGAHGSCPHYIKVCITKTDNDPEVFELLKSMADGTSSPRLNRLG